MDEEVLLEITSQPGTCLESSMQFVPWDPHTEYDRSGGAVVALDTYSCRYLLNPDHIVKIIALLSSRLNEEQRRAVVEAMERGES